MNDRTSLSSRALRGSALAAALCAPAVAQQFTSSALPGAALWTEGVSSVDVDLDGDLDLLFANGDGFFSVGAPRQNTLFINQLVETGSATFVDESVARLGANTSNAKQAISADVNGDGYPDLLYANAFNTGTPLLYINRGAAQPGFFDLESATRGLTEVLNSAGAQFGDIDDDGDQDLVVTDAGTQLLGGAGSTPRMYLNDGAGFFTDASAQLNAPVKVAQQDVNLVDMDNDWDLDVVIVNRASNSGGTHYLLLNDGTGNFTNASTLLPTTSASVYEAEVGDLDGDNDRDFFFLSLGGFQEGHVRNNLVETGSLGFTTGALEAGNVDDNEVALFDFDVDGDFDILVGSLGNRERMYLNVGGLNFVPNNAVVQPIGDSTLDLTVADLDNDGDYDFVTGQGESGNFTNRIYLNSGPADDRAPLVPAVDAPESAAAWPITVRSRVRDQVMDDGETYVSVETLVAPVLPTAIEIELTPFGFVPQALTVDPGTIVRFRDGTGAGIPISAVGVSDWSREFGPDALTERVFVAPITHTVVSLFVPGTLEITVSPGATAVTATHSGNAIFRSAVPAMPTDPTGRFAFEVQATDWMGNVGYSDSETVRAPGTLGTPYCNPANNSTDEQARIRLTGSDVLADQNLILSAGALPTQSFGFFLASQTQGDMSVSQGVLCIGQPFSRFSNFIQNSGATGEVSLNLPFGGLPPSATFVVGDTWNFTYWFRDANPAVGANFTDGVVLTWR